MTETLEPDHGARIAAKHGIVRSPEWRNFKRKVIAEMPRCLCCGGKDGLDVHHLYPLHFIQAAGRADLELDRRNVNPFCQCEDRMHHLLLGHSGCFESFTDPLILPDVLKLFGTWTAEQIRLSPSFLELERRRPQRLECWGVLELKELKKTLDNRFPVFTGS